MTKKPLSIFISQPMSGKNPEDVKKRRDMVINRLHDAYGETYDVHCISTYERTDAPENATRLWYLGAAIQDMADADLICVVTNDGPANGCMIEICVAELYDIPIIEVAIDDDGTGIIIENPFMETRHTLYDQMTKYFEES